MKTARLDLQTAIQAALTDLRVSGDSLAENVQRSLEKSGVTLAEAEIPGLLESELNVKAEDVLAYTPNGEVLRALPAEAVRAYTAMPLEWAGDKLKVGLIDPTDAELILDLHLLCGAPILPVAADRQSLEKLIAKHYQGNNGSGSGAYVDFSAATKSGSGGAGSGGNGVAGSVGTGAGGPGAAHGAATGTANGYGGGFNGPAGSGAGQGNGAVTGGRTSALRVALRKGESDSPIVRLVNEIISEAIHAGSSDIHFESFERELKVRIRQDGVLRVHRTINARSTRPPWVRSKCPFNLT